ncbi:MAG: AsmA-like C-terminal region-containing protein [Limisphaerales bacterium]
MALLLVLLWLNLIGLPNFAKRPLIEALRQHGIALEFVRLRLNFLRGLVADNVRVGGELPESPSLSVQELQLQINYRALLRRKLLLDGVVLRHGKFILPVSASNDPPCALIFDHIQTELRFQTNDVWTLDNFQASFAGANFLLSGQISNASAVSQWGMFHGKKGVRGASRSQLKKIGTTLSQIHFNKNSLVSLNVHGDARHLNSFFVFLTVNAPGAQTPWGSAENLEAVAHSTVSAGGSGKARAPPPLEILWKAQLGRLKTGMAAADYVYSGGSWRADGEINWRTEVARLHSKKLDADFVSCDGFWRAPDVEITNLYARLGGGHLRGAARLNVNTREFDFTNSSCFDPQAIAGLMTDKMRERMDQFGFPRAPGLRVTGSLVLPPWTHDMSDYWRSSDWRGKVQPGIRLDGELAVTNPMVSGYSLDFAHGRFMYSNEIWTVRQALLTRATAHLRIQGNENDKTKEYQWRVNGQLSPDIIGPFLTTKTAREFRHFSFARPLVLNARVHGRLYDYDSIIADGHAALTNFSVHGELVDRVETAFHYAHQVIEFERPSVVAGVQRMSANAVRVDWAKGRIYFDQARGIAEPQAVANAIGPLQARIMKPYHFLAPVKVVVSGYAPLRNPTNVDLVFKSAGPVQIQILNIRSHALSGEIHWVGQTLTLSNLDASLYGGRGAGNISFDFSPRNGANFSFSSDFQDVDLHELALDLNTRSNHLEHLEGQVDGHFVVTSGYSQDWRSCNGYGQVTLHNGLLWDVPVFGGLSPALNQISPGLGNSRARDASAQFFMTNGVIATDDLKIHTTMMVLQCNGTVDLKGGLNAHFTAEPLHDIPIISQVMTPLSWTVGEIFEFKVTGTWNKPRIRLLHLPSKVFTFMLHPIHSLESLEPEKNRKNTQRQTPQ